MGKRLNNKLYTHTILAFEKGKFYAKSNSDGSLFSGRHKTKIYPSDLPEWYLYGRYYRMWGYMSTKGIVDMLYRPNMHVNHFLKDDFLYISYDKKIEAVTAEDREKNEKLYRYERYKGYDEVVFGREIIEILKGARQYSNYDIRSIIEQIKEKEIWLRGAHPREFSYEQWKYDVEEDFATGISDYARRREHLNW